MDRAQLIVIPEQRYNVLEGVLKSIKSVSVESGKYYEVVGPMTGDILYFQCVKGGVLKIGYKYLNGNDVFRFSGDARMKFEQEITEGMGVKP